MEESNLRSQWPTVSNLLRGQARQGVVLLGLFNLEVTGDFEEGDFRAVRVESDFREIFDLASEI